MKQVSLEHCWKWVCPECGESNVAEMVPAELNAEEREELQEFISELPDGMGGELMTAPEVVTCLACFEEFKTDIREDD